MSFEFPCIETCVLPTPFVNVETAPVFALGKLLNAWDFGMTMNEFYHHKERERNSKPPTMIMIMQDGSMSEAPLPEGVEAPKPSKSDKTAEKTNAMILGALCREASLTGALIGQRIASGKSWRFSDEEKIAVAKCSALPKDPLVFEQFRTIVSPACKGGDCDVVKMSDAERRELFSKEFKDAFERGKLHVETGGDDCIFNRSEWARGADSRLFSAQTLIVQLVSSFKEDDDS